ncbi:hypothetical protein [Ferruginibacter profundus]
MKRNPDKGRLKLKKQAVYNLTATALHNIKGGNEEAWTTSKRACTGFLCCEPQTDACPTNLTCTTICTTIFL